MIRKQLQIVVFFLVFLISTVPLYADYIVTEKGEVGDLRWWSDQVLTSGNTLYILGHMKNPLNETVYKLYIVDTISNAQSNIVLIWEDDSPVQISQKFIGFSGSTSILIHWWEKDYYSLGNGAEVTGSIDVTTGKVTRWQADPVPDITAAPDAKTGILVDLTNQLIDSSYAREASNFLKQGIDKDGNPKLYWFNTDTRITDAAVITEKYSTFLSRTGNTPYVLWDETGSGSFKYGQLQTDGLVVNINDFINLKRYYRSIQKEESFLINGLTPADEKRLYILKPDYIPPSELKTTSLPFVDQSRRYDIYAVNAEGNYITLWWDAAAQRQKYGIISNNSVISLLGSTTVKEDAASVTIIAQLSNTCSEDVVVYLETNREGNDTALSNIDYTFGNPGKIVIPAGSVSGTTTLNIINDIVYDPGNGETLTVYVASLENAITETPQTITITITEVDADADGMADDWESQHNLDSPTADPDHDGLSNLEEFQFGTDPKNHDSDGDGHSDGSEVYHGTDPLVYNSEVPLGSIIYVNAEAVGAATGINWEDAFTNLDTAIDNALDGDSIWVSAGVYTPSPSDLSNPRDAAFSLPNGISLFGGFSGIETIVDERDPEFNETTISGDIGILDDSSDNVYHVFFFNENNALDVSTIIDGFTISGGNANGSGINNRGGGIYTKESSPLLSQILFKENYAEFGGGLYSETAGPELSFCLFTGNEAVKSGGGLQCDNSKPLILNSIFEGNISGSSGGGIDSYKSTLTIKNCLFFNNEANLLGGAVNAYDSEIKITGCTITQNKAVDNGGGLSVISGILDISACIIYENIPSEIHSLSDSVSVIHSCISGGYEGVDNIDENPLFADTENTDFSLSGESPCINSGDPAATEDIYDRTDLTGRPRISCATIDMGAFEMEEPVCTEQAQASAKSSGSSGICFISVLNETAFPFYATIIFLLTVVARLFRLRKKS